MVNELLRVIKEIKIENLIEEDKEELIFVFMATKNALIRNRIALIFSDITYNRAVPFLIKKINDSSLLNNNGTLVYALQDLDTSKYFIQIIKIICNQDYEARLMAFEIIEKEKDKVSTKVQNQALKILEDCRSFQEKNAKSRGKNSTLHFIEQTIAILN